MSSDRSIPTQAATDLPTFTILVEGEDIGGLHGVLGLVVSKAVNTIPKARLLLADGDVASGDFELSSGDLFLPGKEVEIRGGYHNVEDTLFRGIIIRHGIRADEGRNPFLQIDMRDVAVRMTVGRKNRYFEAVKDSEIIEELVAAYGLEKEVEETGVEHREMVQYYTTDWDFMISRAEVNSRLIFVDDGKITVREPDLQKEPLLNLALGHNVIAFEAEMDARDQYPKTTSKTWDYTGQEVIEEEAEDPGLSEQGNLSGQDLSAVVELDHWLQQHGGRVEDRELKAWSDSRMLKSRMAKVRGRVKITGFSDIRPGDMIRLEEFGERFNGPAFVSSVNHHQSKDSAWYTEIGFGLDPEWFINRFEDIVARQASGLLPPIHGLQVGVVTNIDEDPDGEDRIKVRLPVVDPQHEGIWARMAAVDAGENRGWVFRPEIEDEVIVGFINDDPRDAVILGMLHSSSKPSPIPAEEENGEKGLVTRSGLKLMFDDEKRSVVVETPNGNRWVLSDEDGHIEVGDENGNKLKLDQSGISIESAGDLTLKASGDVVIEGTHITGSASASFKADGGSGAELTSNGQTVVKGSLVSIN